MNHPEHRLRQLWGAVALAVLMVAGLQLVTNSLDTQKYRWDFVYYIQMAQSGFRAQLANPFAYRYVTPFLASAASRVFGFSIESGFRTIAYLGALLQLVGVFLFTRWFTRSLKGAYLAIVVTAFSLFNIKFLLFDVYRPDHLAYACILLQTYWAMKRRFWPLLLTTLVASQIREFNLIPLLAYLFACARDLTRMGSLPGGRRTLVIESGLSALGLVIAVGGPRLLIPVTENYAFADASLQGLLSILNALIDPARDASFIYSIVAYLVPVLMLVRLQEIPTLGELLGSWNRSFLLAYTGLVLAFSFLGGTDFFRFATFLFMPQAILVGLLAARSRPLEIGIMLTATFIFNRIWLPFPMSDEGRYLDFYGGFAGRFNSANVLRLTECLLFIAAGLLARRFRSPGVTHA